MREAGVPCWEIILVDDGSTDGSGFLLKALAAEKPHVRTIHFIRNYGQTAALDAGIRQARFPFILTLDSDLQNDPRDFLKLYRAMAPGVGCVCGVRRNRRDSAVKHLSSKLANWVRNRLSWEDIADTGCGLKLFRKACLDRIKLYRGMHRFLPTLVKLEGFKVVEVPVNHFPRLFGVSKYGIGNRVFCAFVDLLAVRWMKKRYLDYQIQSAEELGNSDECGSNNRSLAQSLGPARTLGPKPLL